MRLYVKICGITGPDSARAAVDAGADALGFVFSSSPRRVTVETAASTISEIPEQIQKVAVFRRPRSEEIRHVLENVPIDLVQADHLHLAGAPAQRRLPVFRDSDRVEDRISAYFDGMDGGRYLYEGSESGVGRKVDWSRACLLARRGEMLLAGGLDPQNVAGAIRAVRPFGVDVSSGVESHRGVKDPGLIREFVTTVRAVEREMSIR